MTNQEKSRIEKGNKVASNESNCTISNYTTDKNETNNNFNSTQIVKSELGINDGKFDIPKRETNPNKTGIDTESDKTKKEK